MQGDAVQCNNMDLNVPNHPHLTTLTYYVAQVILTPICVSQVRSPRPVPPSIPPRLLRLVRLLSLLLAATTATATATAAGAIVLPLVHSRPCVSQVSQDNSVQHSSRPVCNIY